MTNKNFKYKAFVSYKHIVDSKKAEKVEKAIQKFNRSWYDFRAEKIFRDENSLSPNQPLSSILEELPKAEYLIYFASLEGAKSEWVEQELLKWFELGRKTKLIYN